jgi:hypothetical protein
MKLFHRTTLDRMRAIVADGFRDGTGRYLTDQDWSGVWFADRPLDIDEGARGEYVLTVDIPESVVVPYEWVEEGKPYREFLVPATVANQYGSPSVSQNRSG